MIRVREDDLQEKKQEREKEDKEDEQASHDMLDVELTRAVEWSRRSKAGKCVRCEISMMNGLWREQGVRERGGVIKPMRSEPRPFFNPLASIAVLCYV